MLNPMAQAHLFPLIPPGIFVLQHLENTLRIFAQFIMCVILPHRSIRRAGICISICRLFEDFIRIRRGDAKCLPLPRGCRSIAFYDSQCFGRVPVRALLPDGIIDTESMVRRWLAPPGLLWFVVSIRMFRSTGGYSGGRCGWHRCSILTSRWGRFTKRIATLYELAQVGWEHAGGMRRRSIARACRARAARDTGNNAVTLELRGAEDLRFAA